MNRGLKNFILTITCLITAFGAYQALAQDQNSNVAVVNGTVISQEQFDRAMIPYQEVLAATGKTFTDEDLMKVKQKCLDTIIQDELLNQECQKNAIEVNDVEVNQKFDSNKGKFANNAAFQERLKELNTDEASYKLQLKKQLARQRLINQKFKPSVTDDEAKAYYTANPDKYKDTSFEQAKAAIIKQLGTDKISDSYLQFCKEIKAKAKIESSLK